jgi:hypothetical protein
MSLPEPTPDHRDLYEDRPVFYIECYVAVREASVLALRMSKLLNVLM